MADTQRPTGRSQDMTVTDLRADRATVGGEQDPSLRTRRKTPWVMAVILIIAGGLAIWWAVLSGGAEEVTEGETADSLSFDQVVMADLTEVTEYDGTVGRLEGDPVTVRVSGTVTAVPAEGTELVQGDALVWVDNQPVTLLYGDLPVWRAMADDIEGPDVLQLETALVALGFDEGSDMTVDEEFTSFTESIVSEWQVAIGAVDDGVVDLGEVVFGEGPVTVGSLQVDVGDVIAEGAAIFTTSSSELQVRFDLPTTEENSLSVGDSVEVTMPDLTTTTGTVSEIATVASVPDGGGQATYEVIVHLDDITVAAAIDEAPVTVGVVTESVTDVVAVPIEALLALSEGGYAVEVEDGSATRLVAVEPGFYADGLIEVNGEIAAGEMVVVP